MREHCIKIRAKAHQAVPFQTRSTTCRTLRRQDALQDESRQAKLSGSQTVYFQKVRLVLNATESSQGLTPLVDFEWWSSPRKPLPLRASPAAPASGGTTRYIHPPAPPPNSSFCAEERQWIASGGVSVLLSKRRVVCQQLVEGDRCEVVDVDARV